MRLGKVLTYKDVDEARRLLGKKVVASDGLRDLEILASTIHPGLLEAIDEGPVACPFQVSGHYSYQFIREILDEAKYEPYDLSDKKVRDSLRGRWFRDEYDNEVPVSLFDYHKNRNVWQVNGYSSKSFLEKCKWLDGTPCGRRVDKEMGLPILTRDEEETR